MKAKMKYPGRLTERTADGILVKEDYGDNALKTLYQCHGEQPMPHYVNCDESYCAMDKLAEYEDLEEQGKLLKLPCAVGDTLYHLCILKNKEPLIIKMKVGCVESCGAIRNHKGVHEIWNVYAETDYTKGYFKFFDFGKTVFLTREEAEAALKEL